MRILLVEDNFDTRVKMKLSLEKWGYDVVSVDNISLAISIILTEKIQFVITDWIMPDGNGTVLFQGVRTLNLPFYTYMILMTSLDDTQFAEQVVEAGPDDFILKPIHLDELHARIRAGEHRLKKLRENNFRMTEISNKLLATNEVTKHDLKMAANMQRSLLPIASSNIQGITIEWLLRPSTNMSGDIFNFFRLDEHHVGFYILDVAGHGTASAMQSSVLSRLLSPDMGYSNHLKFSLPEAPYYQLRSASSVVENLNQQFQTNIDYILYFTMIYGVIDTLSCTIELCQAGHPHSLYLQKGKQAEFIVSGGLPVGIITDASYESVHLKYCSGDRFFLYSDGITECESPDGEMFGSERLRLFVDETRHLNVSEVTRLFDERISSWRGSEGFEDDISMLVLEIL